MNILLIWLAEEALKLFIFNDIKELQLLNMFSIFWTLEVLKEFKSNDISE